MYNAIIINKIVTYCYYCQYKYLKLGFTIQFFKNNYIYMFIVYKLLKYYHPEL